MEAFDNRMQYRSRICPGMFTNIFTLFLKYLSLNTEGVRPMLESNILKQSDRSSPQNLVTIDL